MRRSSPVVSKLINQHCALIFASNAISKSCTGRWFFDRKKYGLLIRLGNGASSNPHCSLPVIAWVSLPTFCLYASLLYPLIFCLCSSDPNVSPVSAASSVSTLASPTSSPLIKEISDQFHPKGIITAIASWSIDSCHLSCLSEANLHRQITAFHLGVGVRLPAPYLVLPSPHSPSRRL